jgi:hypothetical protein
MLRDVTSILTYIYAVDSSFRNLNRTYRPSLEKFGFLNIVKECLKPVIVSVALGTGAKNVQ